MFDHLYAEMPAAFEKQRDEAASNMSDSVMMAETTLIGAVNLALARAMEEDDRVLFLGEGVGVNGGVFRATEGLHERFGAGRVTDMPFAELAIGGAAVGMAVAGLRPAAEVQFMGFIYPTVDQMLCHAGRMRGRLTCPMVL